MGSVGHSTRSLGRILLLALIFLSQGCEDSRRNEVPAIGKAAPEPVATIETPAVPAVSQQQAVVLGHEWRLTEARKKLLEEEVAAPSLAQRTEVPFVLLRTEGTVGRVLFDLKSRRSILQLDSGKQLSFPFAGIPVALQKVDGSNRYVIAFRSIPRNTLWMIEWNARTGTIRPMKVERRGVDYLMLRGAVRQGRVLYWVVYDSHAEKNYLRRYERRSGTWQLASPEVELPSLEDPAGTHYEMVPPLFLFAESEKAIRIVGGTLDALIKGRTIEARRIGDCERVLEAVSARNGVAVLCNRKQIDARGAYAVHLPGGGSSLLVSPQDGIPWRLSWDDNGDQIHFQLARDSRGFADLFEYDLERSQNSGLLDFGSDNIEGRIPWSQIYYLNGLMDTIYMARCDDQAYDLFFPLLRKIRLRLEWEIRLLDRLLADGSGLHTRGFTHDRSPALFAVQSSRVLLLLTRYTKEFPDAQALSSLDHLRQQVETLDGHIEELANSSETEKWLEPGVRHLRWPRGSAFYFDGLAVPYNHQNEWAYALFENQRALGAEVSDPRLDPQREIIGHFLRHLAPNGRLPHPESWYYWWGHAYDGYDLSSGRSVHTPSYVGDKSLAWISFRTIDLMSVLASLDFLPGVDRHGLLDSARERILEGDVYPFASRSLIAHGIKPELERPVAHQYARTGSPWEIANSPWALAILPSSTEVTKGPH